MGQLIQTTTNILQEDELILNTESLSDGVYFLRTSFNNSDQNAVRKIAVRH